jgi:hypothetical protein
MTAKQALAEAVRRWGKKAAVQDRGKKAGMTPADREKMRLEFIELNKIKLEEPNLQTWPGDAPVEEYRVALRAHRKASRELREKKDWFLGRIYSFRFYVGVATWAFEIKGTGDTWEEAFADADRKSRHTDP